MLYKKIISLTLVVSSIFLISCNNDDKEESTPQETKSVQIDARSYADWVYFSFESGTVVEIDPQNFDESLQWDIAFHRNDIRLNCGESGGGLGGAYTTDKVNLSEVTLAPETGYVVDATKTVMTQFVLPSPVFEEQPANLELNWLNIDTSSPPPVYTLLDKVFIIKTASGKYAKIKFTNYLSNMNETMVITMNYVYQSNGSRNF